MRSLALVSACEHLTDESGVDHADFWNHALLVAVIAERLAERVEADTEEAFMAGLLHDIGEVVLMEQHDGYGTDVLERVGGTPSQLDAERALYGQDHVDVAVAILSTGPFTPEVIDAIRHHHERVLTTQPLLDRVVGAADRMAQRLRQVPRASRDELDSVLRDAGLSVLVDGALLVEIRRGHDAMRVSLRQS